MSPLKIVTTDFVVCLDAEDLLVVINVKRFLLLYSLLHLAF